MTQNWKAEREAIRARRTKAIEGPYFVSMDRAHDTPDHADSGLAKIDTGRESDWWIARLCEWPTAKFLAASWDDIGVLLDHADEDEREIERLRVVEALYTARVNEPQNEAGETAVEPGDIIYALRSELASREQRISELEAQNDRLRSLSPYSPGSCMVCGGQPLASGRECVCGGKGTMDEELRGLRITAMESGEEVGRLRKANERVVDRLKGLWSTEMGNDWNGAINKAIGIIEAARQTKYDFSEAMEIMRVE